MKKDTSKIVDLDELFAKKEVDNSAKELVTESVDANAANNIPNIDAILEEWSWRCDKGYPTIVNGKFVVREEVEILNTILKENGFNPLPLPSPTITKNPAPMELNEDTTEDNSEVLCIYYCCVDERVIEDSKMYLESTKAKGPKKAKPTVNKPLDKLTIPVGLTPKNLGTGGDKALKNLIKSYNDGKPNVKIFVNAITSAELIRQRYGRPIKPEQLDRGTVFEEIKDHGVELVRTTMEIKLDAPDKWSPADIMIYNGINIATIKKTNTVDALNRLFTKDISSESKKIVGMSLKQHTAQGGKALSFKKALTRKEHFTLADDLSEDDKLIRGCLYLSAVAKSDAKSGKTVISDRDKIGYMVELIKKPIPEAADLQNSWKRVVLEARASLEKTLGKAKVKKILELSTEKAKNEVRTLIGESPIKYSKGYDTSAAAFNKQALGRAQDLYTSSAEAFRAALKERDYAIKATPVDATKMGSSFLYRKASCYKLATWFLTGMGAGLEIPAEFKSIAKEQNPFIALTAYAIGYTGISPYFIKVIGAGDDVGKLKSKGHAVQMGGEGILKAKQSQDVSIVDSSEYAGFQVELKLSADNAANTTYEVLLDFRFAGTQINIEVSKIS